MATTVCPSRETLFQYSIGILNGQERDDLDEHLDSCPDCQTMIMTLDDGDDTVVGRLRMPPNDSFMDEPQLQTALKAAMELPLQKKGPFSPSEPSAEMAKTLGEYQILEELGRGGMGRVYKARHTKLNRVAAVKLLARPKLGDPQAMSRFEREMQAIGLLDHPNIVQAHDAREIDEMPVLIMEFIDGLDLAELVRRIGPVPMADACELIRRTALALQYAHEHGLVHRDIKPSNIMLSKSGEVKLLDLGLARFYVEAVAGEEMTGSGQAMGTADYMAPEQATDSRSADIRADIYSLGCTLYKLLSGRAPFSGPEYRGTLDKMNAHVQEAPRSIRELVSDIPGELAAIIDRMLAKNPADRFAVPADVAAAVVPFCEGGALSELITRAMTLPRESWAKPDKSRDSNLATPHPATAPNRRRPIVKYLLIGMGFFGAIALSFGAGILITIKRNGETQQLNVPNNSQTTIDENGNATVNIGGKPMVANPAAELEALQGTWLCVAAADDGKNVLDEEVKGVKLTLQITGETFVLKSTRSKGGLKGTIAVDPTKNPATIDMSFPEGKTLLGIYVRKNDTWTICSGPTRPTEFKTAPRLDQKLHIYRRENPSAGATPLGQPTHGEPPAVNPAAELKAAEASVTSFRTAKITRGDITATIAATGTVEPEDMVDVGASVSGKVEKIFVEYNSAVKKNDLLAQIDPTTYKDRVDQANSAYRRADADTKQAAAKLELADAELEAARQSNQKVPGSVPASALKTLETNEAVAKAAFEAAYADKEKAFNEEKIAKRNLDSTDIRSPIDGVVIARRVNQGQYVSEGKNSSLFLIAKGIDKMQVWASVNEADISRIKEGMEATFTVDAFPNETFKAKVTQIRHNASMNQAVVTYTVVLSFENTGKKLLPYMTANVRFQIESRRDVLRVLNEALIHDLSTGPQNARLTSKKSDGTYHTFRVKIGVSDGFSTEVSGEYVKEGMEVLISSQGPLGGAFGSARPSPARKPAVTPAINPAAELKALQGQWKVTKVEKGTDADKEWAKVLGYSDSVVNPATASRFRFDEGKLHVLSFETAQTWRFGYRFDPYTATKQIDLTFEPGTTYESAGLVAEGIYEIKDGRLKIHLARLVSSLNFDQRPRSFAVDPNSGDMLFTLERLRPSNDEEALESRGGRWAVTSQIDDGKPVAEEQQSRLEWKFNENSFASLVRGKNTGVLQLAESCPMSGLYCLNADKPPMQIRFFADNAAGKFERQDYQGIYKLDGDHLTIAFRKNGPAPEKFESTPGSGVALMELKRSEQSGKADKGNDTAAQDTKDDVALMQRLIDTVRANKGSIRTWKGTAICEYEREDVRDGETCAERCKRSIEFAIDATRQRYRSKIVVDRRERSVDGVKESRLRPDTYAGMLKGGKYYEYYSYSPDRKGTVVGDGKPVEKRGSEMTPHFRTEPAIPLAVKKSDTFFDPLTQMDYEFQDYTAGFGNLISELKEKGTRSLPPDFDLNEKGGIFVYSRTISQTLRGNQKKTFTTKITFDFNKGGLIIESHHVVKDNGKVVSERSARIAPQEVGGVWIPKERIETISEPDCKLNYQLTWTTNEINVPVDDEFTIAKMGVSRGSKAIDDGAGPVGRQIGVGASTEAVPTPDDSKAKTAPPASKPEEHYSK